MKPLRFFVTESILTKQDMEQENILLSKFDDLRFVELFKKTISQYVKENILTDKYNSFVKIALIDFEYDDVNYVFSVEFETAVTINFDSFDKDRKVVKRELQKIKNILFKTPLLQDMTLLQDKKGISLLSLHINNTLKEI